jgi:hypothetical protein
MFHRESGVFKTSYAADMALYRLPIAKWAVAAFAGLFIVIAPLTLGEYISILNLIHRLRRRAQPTSSSPHRDLVSRGAFMPVGATPPPTW